MCVAHCRPHTADLLVSTAAVGHDLNCLCVSLFDLIRYHHKNLSTLLNSVRGLFTQQPSETKRERPVRYTREELLCARSKLRKLLPRETRLSRSGRWEFSGDPFQALIKQQRGAAPRILEFYRVFRDYPINKQTSARKVENYVVSNRYA
jgi:hypothetical protein